MPSQVDKENVDYSNSQLYSQQIIASGLDSFPACTVTPVDFQLVKLQHDKADQKDNFSSAVQSPKDNLFTDKPLLLVSSTERGRRASHGEEGCKNNKTGLTHVQSHMTFQHPQDSIDNIKYREGYISTRRGSSSRLYDSADTSGSEDDNLFSLESTIDLKAVKRKKIDFTD